MSGLKERIIRGVGGIIGKIEERRLWNECERNYNQLLNVAEIQEPAVQLFKSHPETRKLLNQIKDYIKDPEKNNFEPIDKQIQRLSMAQSIALFRLLEEEFKKPF